VEEKIRKNRLMKTYHSVLALCLVLFVAQASSAGPEVVSSQPHPENELNVETQTAPEKEGVETAKKKEGYVYNPIGKLDPFVSFIAKDGTGKTGSKSLTARDSELQGGEEIIPGGEPETELETIEIAKLTLTSVIRGESKVWAMVIDPKGKGYFLEKGTKIGKQSGVVDEIICEEKETAYGVEIVRKVVIKVPYRDRSRKIIYRSIEMEMPHKAM
jgi:hypothetical protein